MFHHWFQLFEITLSYLGEEERSVDDLRQAAALRGLVETGVLGEVGEAEGGDQAQDGGRCHADVHGCSHLEVIVVATMPELVGEAACSVVGCSIAEVQAVKADTGCLVEAKLLEVRFTCADGQGGAVPQGWRQVDGGREENRQASYEDGGEGGHEVGVRLRAISNNARDKN